MANYYEYRKAGIPSRHQLLKQRAQYREFEDCQGRRYFIPKTEYENLSNSNAGESHFDRVYVLLRGQYNRAPDADADENEPYEMPESGEPLQLVYTGGGNDLQIKARTIPEDAYRFQFRVVGMIALSFPDGLPQLPSSQPQPELAIQSIL